MAKFTLYIRGYGGEVTLGKITQEQYEYWVDKEAELEAHTFWDPYEAEEDAEYPNPVTDDEDPLFLGYWHELDSVEHTHGASADNLYVIVEDEDGNEIWSTDDVELSNNNRIDKDDLDTGHYAYAYSAEKGEFYYGEFEADTFDPEKLQFNATTILEDCIVDSVHYGEEYIENDGGDTRGKSQGIELFDI